EGGRRGATASIDTGDRERDLRCDGCAHERDAFLTPARVARIAGRRRARCVGTRTRARGIDRSHRPLESRRWPLRRPAAQRQPRATETARRTPATSHPNGAHMMKRFAAAVTIVTLSACATSNPNEAGTTTERVSMSEGGAQVFDVDISRDDAAQTTRFDASPDAIWRMLPEVYAELGLPTPAVDASTKTVAVQEHAVMRRIGDERMSRLLDCGRDMAGDHADTHRIRLDVRTWVTGAAPAV